MLTTRRLVLAISICLFAIGTVTLPAYADGTTPVDCSKIPNDPSCEVHAGKPGTQPGPGKGGGGGTSKVCHYPVTHEVVPCYVPGFGQLADDGCYYKPATGDALAAIEASAGVPTPPGRWYVGTCGHPPSWGPTTFRVFADGVLPNPAVLATDAVKRLWLPLPVIRVNPVPPAAQLVFLPTWLWLDASTWGSRSATASVPGLSVTATADPTRLVFSTGDGSRVSCTGPGTAWTAGANPGAASPDCGHTYTTPGFYRVTATVTWQIRWAGGGQSGTVPDLTTVSTLTLHVTESQALNTNTQG